VIVIVVLAVLALIILFAWGMIHSQIQKEEAEAAQEIDHSDYDRVTRWVDEFKFDVEPYLEDGIINLSEYEAIEAEYNALKSADNIAKIREAGHAAPEISPELVNKWDTDKEISYYQYDSVRRWVAELKEAGISGLKITVDEYISDGIITRSEYDALETKYTRLSASLKIAEIRDAGGDDESPEELRKIPDTWNDSDTGGNGVIGNVSAEIRGDQ